jgi:hypothetical protein
MADFRLGRMGADSITGCPIISQNAYWKGVGRATGPFDLTTDAP